MGSYCDHLVWLDLETTGTDEYLAHIIEIGITVSQSASPFAERDRFTSIVLPVLPTPMDLTWVDNLSEVVRDMHQANGLIEAVSDGQRTSWATLNPAQIEADVIDFLRPFGKRLLLAGSGVGHFDRRFLRRQMPLVDDRFLFPVLDVGVIRRTCKLIGRDDLLSHGGEASERKPHRALDDAVIHLEEFRHYAELLGNIEPEEVAT